MMYSQQQLNMILEKTDGRCHLCRKNLVRKNYNTLGARGAWEVDHSVPQAKGGTNRFSNLLPACISCNRSKQDSSTKTARRKHGFRASPLSKKKKIKHAQWGALGGGIAVRIMFAPLGLPGIAAGALLGAVISYLYEPE